MEGVFAPACHVTLRITLETGEEEAKKVAG